MQYMGKKSWFNQIQDTKQIDELKKSINEIKESLEDITNMIKYASGGEEYMVAKTHFEEHI